MSIARAHNVYVNLQTIAQLCVRVHLHLYQHVSVHLHSPHRLSKRGDGCWIRAGRLCKPDARMGFPFTNTEWAQESLEIT